MVKLIFFGCYMDLSFFVVELYGIVLFIGFFNGGWIVFDLRYWDVVELLFKLFVYVRFLIFLLFVIFFVLFCLFLLFFDGFDFLVFNCFLVLFIFDKWFVFIIGIFWLLILFFLKDFSGFFWGKGIGEGVRNWFFEILCIVGEEFVRIWNLFFRRL